MEWKKQYADLLRSSSAGSLWGLMVGDALGVPVEGCLRDVLKKSPVKDLRAFGKHHQPLGIFF